MYVKKKTTGKDRKVLYVANHIHPPRKSSKYSVCSIPMGTLLLPPSASMLKLYSNYYFLKAPRHLFFKNKTKQAKSGPLNSFHLRRNGTGGLQVLKCI